MVLGVGLRWFPVVAVTVRWLQVVTVSGFGVWRLFVLVGGGCR